MNTPEEYLEKTRSATKKLFEFIDEYMEKLRAGIGPIYVAPYYAPSKFESNYEQWKTENQEELNQAKLARAEFREEFFAFDTICGAVLQIAEKGLEIYSNNQKIPAHLQSILKAHHAKFCVGREIRDTPLGLIVYAGRNQHTHYNETTLREPSNSIFTRIATKHGAKSFGKDPAFDLDCRTHNLSFASNITSLINWRNFDQYERDMKEMLLVSSPRNNS